MKVGAIIFSRMSSARLPGKAVIDISGKTLIERVIERAIRIKNIDHLCIATSKNKEDDIIESIARSHKIDSYRGSLNNVTQRAVSAARYFKYNSFLRLCGDRPFFDCEIYDELILRHKESKPDITTNIYPRSVPPGLTGEVINVKSLEKCLIGTKSKQDREHVTRYFYKNSDKFIIKNITFFESNDLCDLRLVVDDDIDLNRAIWIAEKLSDDNSHFDTKKIIQLAKKWNELNL
tara:strand:- start:25243 stop:25944 length:702 start_codon:yes stop_codon:yes gene_type:complete